MAEHNPEHNHDILSVLLGPPAAAAPTAGRTSVHVEGGTGEPNMTRRVGAGSMTLQF